MLDREATEEAEEAHPHTEEDETGPEVVAEETPEKEVVIIRTDAPGQDLVEEIEEEEEERETDIVQDLLETDMAETTEADPDLPEEDDGIIS